MESLFDYLDETRFDLDGYCAHATDEQIELLATPGTSMLFLRYADITDDGVSTCIFTHAVLGRAVEIYPAFQNLGPFERMYVEVGE